MADSIGPRRPTLMKTALWAIDPFEKSARPDPWTARQLIQWMKTNGCEIQPIHILYVTSVHTSQIGDGRWVKDATDAAAEAAIKYVADLGIGDVLPPRIVVSREQAHGNLVRALLSFAERPEAGDAQMIALSSHGRSGLFAFGSFAETVLLHSRIPVLFLAPSSPNPASSIRRILFPTDLSGSSRAAFRYLLPQIQGSGTELLLYHAAPSAAQARRELAPWVAEGNEAGLSCRSIIDDRAPARAHLSQAILAAAERNSIQLIAMPSEGGMLSSWVPGSIARDVFRDRRWPVWVCGPAALSRLRAA